jgi:hypothetical protein
VVYDFDERRDFRLERSFYVVGASCRKLASDRVELIGPESYPGARWADHPKRGSRQRINNLGFEPPLLQ